MQREDLSDAVKSLKELQEFAVRQNDSDMLGVISQAKVFVESQAANPAWLLEKIKKKWVLYFFLLFSLMFACPGLIFYTVCSVPWLNGNLALAEKCSGPLRFRLRQVLLYDARIHEY